MCRMAQITPLSVVTLPAGSLQGDAGRVLQVAGLADGRVDAELELLGHGDFNLRGFAGRSENAHPFDSTSGADERHLLLAGVLAGL